MNDFTQHSLFVVIGGGAGSWLRFTLGRLAAEYPVAGFPWPTLAINVIGSLLLGTIAAWCGATRPGILALLGVGLCGGFTTFSTFSLETLKLIEAGRFPAAMLYVAISVLAGLLGAWLGTQLGRPAV